MGHAGTLPDGALAEHIRLTLFDQHVI